MKKITAVLLAVFLLLISVLAGADRIPEPKGKGYIGAMRVVRCKEYVTLREEPDKTAHSLAHVPLGEIVYSCRNEKSRRFITCEYQGETGYILRQYLDPAPEFEPPVSSAITVKMTMEEVLGEKGEPILEWDDYNISVVAVRDSEIIDKVPTEVMRIGCFLDGNPLWGHVETLEKQGDKNLLKTFIGGTEDDPQVMVFDGGYGLTMLDLLSGKDKWTVNVGNCPMGDAAAVAVDEDTGTIYLAGSDTPPVAITQDGRVLWEAEIDNPNVYDPFDIQIKDSTIEIKYTSGKQSGYKLVILDNTGDLIDIEDVKR